VVDFGRVFDFGRIQPGRCSHCGHAVIPILEQQVNRVDDENRVRVTEFFDELRRLQRVTNELEERLGEANETIDNLNLRIRRLSQPRDDSPFLGNDD